jgi:hypothetical protein
MSIQGKIERKGREEDRNKKKKEILQLFLCYKIMPTPSIIYNE